MAYAVEVPRRVQKRAARLPAGVRERISSAVGGLAQDPRPPGCRKLSGRGDEWRVRVGDYRIVYEVNDDNGSVPILEIWRRQRNYK